VWRLTVENDARLWVGIDERLTLDQTARIGDFQFGKRRRSRIPV